MVSYHCQEGNHLAITRKGERRRMEQVEKITIHRLIEWLKKHGHTSEEIVECIEYITGGDKKEKG